jgi:hypothetical protein
MDPRTRNYFVLVIVLVVGLTAAAAVVLGGAGRGDPNTPPNAEQVTGVIVNVESEGLTDVRGFTIRTDGNVDMAFVLDRLENGVDFPPGHLVEHQAASSPIRVWYRTEGGVNYAIRLEDADQTG